MQRGGAVRAQRRRDGARAATAQRAVQDCAKPLSESAAAAAAAAAGAGKVWGGAARRSARSVRATRACARMSVSRGSACARRPEEEEEEDATCEAEEGHDEEPWGHGRVPRASSLTGHGLPTRARSRAEPRTPRNTRG